MAGWDYEKHPERHSVTNACTVMQQRLVQSEDEQLQVLADTRPFHKEIFEKTTLDGFEAYAGCYRGAKYDYLIDCPVYIGGHNQYGVYQVVHIGTPPEQVESEMGLFHNALIRDVFSFDDKAKQAHMDQAQRLIVFSSILAARIVQFLSIHPYVNGNGHISRLIAWTLFLLRGFNISNWNIDIRPSQPFDECIRLYQKGEPQHLRQYFFTVLVNGAL
ncbi:Fic family protein [Alcaligenes faecalis]|uniref:Fic family protein n=1 Tax=Alcaligenes faecalis TaxID=511 RepID=UPI001C9B8790|nr:Fic family protein [Alcaligenes faecalis]MBY6309924.1 hypothetical protein [Alcaligenes faecalis]MBY6315952.1 hypothetical protein [Alcaligenes faecalis]MBY6390841.1 hypothetical protein [Alcaligenes faecalis]